MWVVGGWVGGRWVVVAMWRRVATCASHAIPVMKPESCYPSHAIRVMLSESCYPSHTIRVILSESFYRVARREATWKVLRVLLRLG